MKTENKKDYLIALLWLICGYLCWLSGVYLLRYESSNLVLPISEYINTTFNSYFISSLTTFMLLYMADFILIFFATIFLSRATGKRLVWFVVFLIGCRGRTLYGTINGIIFHMNNYGTLPSEMTSWLFESLAANFIIAPLIAWLGIFIGHKYRTAKQA